MVGFGLYLDGRMFAGEGGGDSGGVLVAYSISSSEPSPLAIVGLQSLSDGYTVVGLVYLDVNRKAVNSNATIDDIQKVCCVCVVAALSHVRSSLDALSTS